MWSASLSTFIFFIWILLLVIQSLESQGLSLTDSFSAVTAAESKLRNLPGVKGEAIQLLQEKNAKVYAKNPDLNVLRCIHSVLPGGNESLPDDISPQQAALF